MLAAIRTFMVLGIGALAVLAPTAGTAAPPLIASTGLSGPLVNAEFVSTDPTGCVETDVFVSANTGTEQDHPGTIRYGVASVSLFEYDVCSDTVVRQAVGLDDALAAGQLQVSKQLDLAVLNATIEVTDIDTGASFPVTVDVTWTGTRDIRRDHSNTNDLYPGCHVINRWKGSGRDAVAAGVVSDGVSNLIPDASQGAEIGYVVDGFEIIGCA
jgi:hypothetical protein